MSDLLLVDVGGTNMRYAYCESGANEIHKSEKISLKNLDNFDTIIGDLIDNSDLSITNAVFSIAGPKIGNTISMTNRSFVANADNLLEKFKLDQCHLLNDWESIGYSLKGTPEDKIEYLKLGVQINSNSLVLGPGTGLGAAFTSRDSVIATELGNTTNWTSSLLKNFAINNDNDHYKTLEDIVSGSGISKLYESISGESTSAEEVIKRFNQNEDLASNIINGFIKSLANVLSDAALAYVPGNGIFLAGGLSRTLLPLIDKELFKDHFLENKSVIHKELLSKIRIGIITRELTCLYGNLNYFRLLNKAN